MNKKPVHVLLIEDDFGDADLLQEILFRRYSHHFEIEWVDRLQTGLARLAQGGIDVILLDLGLPDGQGLETLTRVQAQAPDMPVVVLSGLIDESIALEAVQQGAQDYLIKGQVDGNLLSRVIRYAIERKRATEALQRAHDELERRVAERTADLAAANEQLKQEIIKRKRVEQALRQSEENFRALADNANDGIAIVAGEGKHVYVNQGFAELTGYSQAELLEIGFRELAHPAELPKIQEKYRQRLAGEDRPVLYETRLVRENGQILPVEIAAGNTIWQGQPAGIVIARDITERKQLEERLRAIYQLGRELPLLHDEPALIQRVLETTGKVFQFESASYSLMDETGNELVYHDNVVNGKRETIQVRLSLLEPAGQDIGGAVIRSEYTRLIPDVAQALAYTPAPDRVGRSKLQAPLMVKQQMIGTFKVESTTPNRFTAADQQLLQTLAHQAAVALENARLHRETRRWAREMASLNKAGRTMTSSLNLDIVLKQTLDEIRTMIDAACASILLFDQAGDKLVFAAVVGPKAEAMMGTAVPLDQSIAGWTIREKQAILVTDAQHDSRFYDRIDAATGLTTQSLLAVPLFYRDRAIGVIEAINKNEGSFTRHDLEILESLASVATSAIENSRLYKELQDRIQALQEAQTQLVASEKMAALGRLMASITHEINNPLQAIQNSLALLTRELQSRQRPDKMEAYLHIAGAEIERISTLTHRMRNFYGPLRQKQLTHPPEKGSVDTLLGAPAPEFQAIDLRTILGSTLQLVEQQLLKSNITLKRQWADDLPPVWGHSDSLKQVFLNLLLNAVEAMSKPGGILVVGTALHRAHSTTGQLVPVARLEFSDTGQGIPPEDVSRIFEPFFSTKEHGSGLGLATSYKIIESHQGRISVESQVGLGTTFTILLPLAHPTPQNS